MQINNIDIKLLRVFKTVVDAGGFTAAEDLLNLSNSTICNYIADLEKRLNLRLCNRGRKGFSLTEKGLAIYQVAVELESYLYQTVDRINNIKKTMLGKLYIGFADNMLIEQDSIIINALKSFTNLAPNVNLNLFTLETEDVITRVKNNQLQIGITALYNTDDDLYQLPLFKEEMSIYCGIGHDLFSQRKEITIKQVSSYPFVDSLGLSSGRSMLLHSESLYKTANAFHQESRLQLILTGNYLGYLPTHIVENAKWKESVRAILPDKLNYINQFYVISKLESKDNILVKAFLNALAIKDNVLQKKLN